MHKSPIVFAVTVAAVLAGVVYVFLCEPAPEAPVARSLKTSAEISGAEQAERRKVRSEKMRLLRAKERSGKERLVLEITKEEIDELDELEKKVLKSLQDALDNNDFAYVRKVYALMKQLGEDKASAAGGGHWSDFIHKSLKQAAIDAFGWFGCDALAEMMDFMTDADPEIAQSATDQLELAMQDVTLADYERAEVLKQLVQVISDADTLDWLFMGVIEARHSVGIDSLLYISQHGTEQAKKMLPDYVELFTGEENIVTESDALTWLAQNPDEPDDEEFYGPMPVD